MGFDFSAEFVEQALKQGKLLVLLDGLDEVPKANQDRVHQAIQDFVSRYSQKHEGNRVIASCRIAAFHSGFTGFTDIELADFDDEQIQQFINQWFQGTLDVVSKTAEKCWSLLNDGSYQSAKELAQTPLLLTFLCVVYDRTQSFPANRAALYRKALDILLEEWAAEKRIRHKPIHEGLNTELEKVLLAEIAYQGFVEDRLFFTREELIGYIQKFLEDSADKPKYLDGKAVLTAIAVQQGILTERAEDIYSFSHLTVQEYLTAQYLSQSPTALTEAVTQYLTEQRWREVFLLVPGLLLRADNLLIEMEQIAWQKISAQKLQLLLSWSNYVTIGSKTSVSTSFKRCISVFLALNLILFFDLSLVRGSVRELKFSLFLSRVLRRVKTLALVHADATDLDDELLRADELINALNSVAEISHCQLISLTHVHDLTRTIAKDLIFYFCRSSIFNDALDSPSLIQRLEALKDKIPSDHRPINVHQKFSDFLSGFLIDNFGLEQELLDLNDIEIQALSDYFYICELMARCKDSAVRVSRDVWESIENAMVMPTPENKS